MIIEQQPLYINSAKLNSLNLSELQSQYVQALVQNHSISSLVEFYLQQGWLVNFTELWSLVEKLVDYQLIQNKEVMAYFSQLKPVTEKGFLSGINPFSEKSVETKFDLQTLPFFRSLPKEWTQLLLKQAKSIAIPGNVLITREGAKDRDLYVLLSGHASVIRSANGLKQVMAQIQSPAVFGEGAFLLGQPRSADILTRSECTVLKVPYTPELDSFIKKDKAEAAQIRIWIQHALSSSALFKNIPPDALDALTFAGRPVRMQAKQCLFAEGQTGTTSYILIQGELLVSQAGKVINQLKQGAFLGEIAMLASGGKRTATIHAASDALLMEIQQNDFYRLLGNNIILGKELEQLAWQRLRADQQRG